MDTPVMMDSPTPSIPSNTTDKSTSRWWQRLIPLVVVVVAIVLAVRGQQIFNERNEALLGTAMLYYGGGALLFLVATLLASPIPFRFRPKRTASLEEPIAETEESAWWNTFPLLRFLLGISSVLLIGGALYTLSLVPRVPQLADYSGIVIRWLAAIALMGIAFFPIPTRNAYQQWMGRVRTLISTHRLELALVLGILIVSGVMRLWALGTIPSHLNGDEASVGMDVQRILNGEIRDPFGLMWGPLPSLSGFVIAGFYQLLGQSVFALRLPGALAGTLSVVALYVLARGFVRREVALGAALLLATLPIHIHYSRIAVNTAWDTFFYTATLAALYWAIERKGNTTPLLLLAGLFMGFSQYAYSGSRLLPAIAIGVVGIYALFYPQRLRGKWIGLVGMVALFLVIASPLYLHAWRYPDDFNARFNQTGIFQTGFVEQEKVARNTDTLGVLTEQLRRTLFGFAYINDTTETWGSETPLVPTLFSLALFLGLLLSLRRWRDPSTALMHGWFWSVIILGGALTTNPPTSNRLISAMPVVALFAAVGWDWVARAFAPDNPDRTLRLRAQQLVLVLFLLGTAAIGIYTYQGYLESNNYGGLNAKVATFIGRDLAQRPAGTTLVALTAPRIYSGMSPIVFQSPTAPRKDYNDLVQSFPTDLPAGDLLIIALPERLGELGSFQAQFGGITPTEVRDPTTNQVLYYSLWVDR
jgi:4-amino-4-deoxy-L-arabinose transferase-like glycosyltransferase